MRRSFVFRLLSTLVAALLGAGMLATSANAVTNGSLVPDPKTNAPYVVSIWNSATDNDYKNAEFTCTGTLIGPQVVLTAAHCVTLTTPYFVKVGAGAINDNTSFTAVSSVWVGDKYNSKTHENDIGLLKLVDRFEDIKFPTLASPVTAKSINKYSKLRIFGWGMDQNKVYPELLSTSDLALQDALAIKTFGKSFNTKTMMAAGRKIVAENVWSGACYGDSGGPLLTDVNGIIVLVGVTSWGSKFCLENKPSIFNRVSFYERQIKNGILALEAQSTVVNRTAPIATIEAELIGQAKPGNTLKCLPGTWKNAVSIQTTWISPARISGSIKADIEVLASDGGSVFKCEVIISSAKASVRRVLSATITGSASLASNPVISGIPDRAIFKSGTTARCEGWNWRTPVDSERVTWFTSSSYSPSVPVNGRQIGTGSSLTFNSSVLRDENGRYLICQVTGVKDGFESHFVASKLITTPPIPTIYSVSVSANSLALGGSASCSYSSYSDVETTQYEWGFESNSGYFSVFTGLSSGRIEITQSLIQQASGRALSCRVTLISSGGQVSKTASTYNTFENLPYSPNVTATISGTPVAGSTAYCNATSNNSYSVNTSYQWGKTSYSGSKSIEGQVLGNSSYYTITSTSLSDLAGAYLTCVVTATNSVGNSSGASSIAIAASSVTLPTASAPTVYSQSPSTTSITVKIQIPSITAFNSTTMQAILNVINSPNCTNLQVQPSSTYDCSGLSANTSYIANISTSLKSGAGSTNRSPNLSFTTNGLNSLGLSTPAAPTFTPISPTEVRVALPGIPGFNANTMNASLYIYYQTSLSALGIDGSAATVIVKELASGKTHTGYIVLRSLTNGSEVKSAVITFTLPTNSALAACTGGTGRTPGLPQCLMPENLPGTTWNDVLNSTGVVINGAVCSPSVCGVNGSWRTARNMNGKSTPNGYPELSTYIQSPTSGASWGKYYTNGVYETSSGQIYQPGSTIPTNSSALNPTFSSVTSTAGGFTFQITNYSSAYTWSTYIEATSQPGAGATISSSGLVTVSGMTSGASATITVRTSRTGYESGTNLIAGTALNSTANQLKIIATGPDSDGITNIGICFTNPSALSGTVTYDINGASSGSFLKHSGTPACPSYASGSSGLRLTPDTTYNYSATASNNGINYSATLTHRTPPPLGDTRNPSIVTGSGVVQQSTVTVGQSVTFTFRATDDIGVTSAGGIIYNGSQLVSQGGSASRVSGTATDGIWSVTLSIPSANSAGTYTISGFVQDALAKGSGYVPVGTVAVTSSVPTKYSGTDAYSGIVAPGSGQFWESGFQNAVSVSVVASSPGEASIVAPYSNSWGGTVVIAVADGMSVGQKLYKAAIYVPVGTPKNKLFTLTWTATSATGQTLVVTEGSFNTGP